MNGPRPWRGSRKGLALASLLVVALIVGVACRDRSSRTASTPTPSSSASSGWETENPDPGLDHVAELNLTRGLPEIYTGGLFSTPKRRSFVDLMQTLTLFQSKRGKKVRGVLVRFGSMRTGFARAQEVARGLRALREGGIPVVCHADEYVNATYWIAAAGCDRLWVSPAGGVDTVGVAAEVLYASRLLGELKVDVDMLQVGRFKGAAEPFTRQGPSDEARESLMGVLYALRETWLDGMDAGRPSPSTREGAENGPHSPTEARNLGMVDGVGYAEDARADALDRAKVEQVVVRFGAGSRDADPSGLVDLVRVLSGGGVGVGAPHIAVYRASGAITMSSAGSLFSDGDGVSERKMSRELRKLRREESTRAVVVRIDSPGGSALASDLLWHHLMELRRAKPLVVSVGDMAASGGYYLACTATHMFAEPTSIVGSIGVVGGKFTVRRGLEHVGVNAEVFPANDAPGAGTRASYLSPFTKWDEPTKERVHATMTSVYDLFVDRVAEGRGLPRDKVEPFAEGRIFAGREAIGLGMVDEIGGLREAISHARRLAGLDEEARVKVVGEESGLDRLLELDDEEDVEARLRQPVRAEGRMLNGVLASVAPEWLRFAASFEPLLHGERTLVAVPFAFLVR